MPELPTGTVGAWEVLDLLTSLVEKSLVLYEEQGGEGRYRLLETVRQYGRDRLLEAREGEAVRDRHLAFLVALVEQEEWESEIARRDRLETEHDNLQAALAWSMERGEAEVGLRLGGALCGFWGERGYWAEAREHLAGLLALPGAQAHAAARAQAAYGAAWLAAFQGDFVMARVLFAESLASYRQIGDKQGIAWSICASGAAAREQGDTAAARAILEESLAISRELGDRLGIAWSLINLGAIAYSQGEYGAARALLEEAVALHREVGNKNEIAYSLGDLARVASREREYEEARSMLEESLAIFAELGNQHGIMTELEWFAELAVAQTQYERAARLYGVVAARGEAIGAVRPAARQVEYERAVTAVHAALGAGAIAAWAEGRAMSLEEAIAYALEASSTA